LLRYLLVGDGRAWHLRPSNHTDSAYRRCELAEIWSRQRRRSLASAMHLCRKTPRGNACQEVVVVLESAGRLVFRPKTARGWKQCWRGHLWLLRRQRRRPLLLFRRWQRRPTAAIPLGLKRLHARRHNRSVSRHCSNFPCYRPTRWRSACPKTRRCCWPR